MSRHGRHMAEALNIIGGEPEPPPFRAAQPPDAPEPDEEPAPELYDYEPIDMTKAKTREGAFNGSPVMISDDETAPGVLAMWYITRKRIGFEWKQWANWVDPITRAEIAMKPKFWRANPRLGAFW